MKMEMHDLAFIKSKIDALDDIKMIKEAGEFMGIKIYVYSKGIRGFFERVWHDLKYKTVYVPEPPKNHGAFSYARFNAGRFLLKERGWYNFIRSSNRRANDNV